MHRKKSPLKQSAVYWNYSFLNTNFIAHGETKVLDKSYFKINISQCIMAAFNNFTSICRTKYRYYFHILSQIT